MKVRAIYRVAAVENTIAPYNRIFLKVFYPAKFDDSENVRNLGIVPPDATNAPLPVVLFFSGVNLGAESYQSLAVELVQKGFIFVSFNWVTNDIPGGIAGLTPGVDLENLRFENYGKAPTGSAIPTLLHELEAINSEGLLKGLLDLQKIVFGGHSAGGSIALTNANKEFFPQVVAAFSYGSHTQGSMMLGFPPDAIMPISADVPFLLLGGANDGVIASSIKRYGKTDADAVLPLRRTFNEAISRHEGDCYLAILAGANHFSLAFPLDETTGRSFLDAPPQRDEAELRATLFELISAFLEAHVKNSGVANEFLNNLAASKDERFVEFKQK